MRISDWKEKEGLNYEELGRRLGLSTNKVFRLCKESICIKLIDAHQIVEATNGEIDLLSFLLEGDC